MGLFPFCLPASFEWRLSFRLRLSAEERAEENWGNHQFENTLGEIKTVGKRIMKILNIKRRGYIEYRLYIINDRLWDFYNHFSWRFSENFEVFEIFLLPQRSIIWIFFPLQWIRNTIFRRFFGGHFLQFWIPRWERSPLGWNVLIYWILWIRSYRRISSLFIVCLFCLFLYIIGPN